MSKRDTALVGPTGSLTVRVILPPTMVMFVRAGPSATVRRRRLYVGTLLGFVVAVKKVLKGVTVRKFDVTLFQALLLN